MLRVILIYSKDIKNKKYNLYPHMKYILFARVAN